MTTPTVSVVIATYNMGQHVAHAIESITKQSVADWELIVVDDGSTDATTEAVAPYLKDPRITYWKQANAGQAVAKNAGIRRTRGRLVGFCDADDAWMPEKLALQIPVFERSERIGLVYSGIQDMPHADAAPPLRPLFSPVYQGKVTDTLFLNNFVPFGTVLVRRECLDKVGLFDERYRMGIDWELWLRVSLFYEFAFVPEVTYLYRVWSGQMSNNWRGRYDYTFRIMTDFLARYPDAISHETAAEAWAVGYASRGRARTYMASEHAQAIMDAFRAIRRCPTYWPAWRLPARVALNALGRRVP